MALLTLAVPERYGGAGFSLEETAIAVAELGRGLAPVPVFEAVLAIEAILRAGTRRSARSCCPACSVAIASRSPRCRAPMASIPAPGRSRPARRVRRPPATP